MRPTEFPACDAETDNEIRGKASHALSGQDGAIAQLGERFNGIEEVSGSIPLGSTTFSIRNSDLDLLRVVRFYQFVLFLKPYHLI